MRAWTRWSWGVCGVLATLLPQQLAWGQSPRIDYATVLDADSRAYPVRLAIGGNDRTWVATARSDTQTTATLSGCEAVRDCTVLSLIDPTADTVVRRVVIPDLVVQQVAALPGGRLAVFGRTQVSSLPHDPQAIWAAPPATAGYWLGVVGADNVLQTGSYLARHFIRFMEVDGDDVLLLAQEHNFASYCADINPGCSRVRVARVAADLRQIHYETPSLAGDFSRVEASTLGSNGVLYVATSGQLSASGDAPFTESLPEHPGEPFYSVGGLMALDARNGQLIRSTFSRTLPATGLVYDRTRNALWVLARSSAGNLPATPDAVDRTCGADGRCGPQEVVFCFAVGICLDRRIDTTLSRFSADLRVLQYATYLGTDAVNWPRALLLFPQGSLLVGWGENRLGNYYSNGPLRWLEIPLDGAARSRSPMPTAPLASYGYAAPLIRTQRPGEFWSVARIGMSTANPGMLVNSTGLDPDCQPGTSRLCTMLARTQVQMLGVVTALPFTSAVPVLLLSLLLISAGLQLRRSA